MNTHLQTFHRANTHTHDQQLINGLRTALRMKYGEVLAGAQVRWQRLYGANDPSDACVSVRISSAPSALPHAS